VTSGGFFGWHWLSLHGLATLLALGVFLTASHSLRQRRNPSAAMAWLLSFILLPYLTLPLYLLIGTRKRPRPLPALRVPAVQQNGTPAAGIRTLAATLSLPPPSGCEFLELHADGSQALRSLLALIDGAGSSVDVSTFLLGRDAVGREIVLRLAQAARRGVRVRLLVDGVGQYLGGHPDLGPLRAAGATVALFAPPLQLPLTGKANLRNHRKLAIADGARLWTGGRNLAVEYFEGKARSGQAAAGWIDLTFELRGAIAVQAQEQFDKDWAFATRQAAAPVAQQPAAVQADTVATMQLVPSGPDQAEDTVYTLLVSGCFAARRRILAVTPYFVPDPTLQMALTLAARRGVAVDLLVPSHSNHRMADMARHAALRDLVRSGAHVWLAPGMIHAKAVVFDDEFALAGSANLDERSLFLNYELMVGFYRAADVQQLAQWIEHQRSDARPYEARRPGLARELGEGAIRWLAFQL
jgi:cardiolipin synthase